LAELSWGSCATKWLDVANLFSGLLKGHSQEKNWCRILKKTAEGKDVNNDNCFKLSTETPFTHNYSNLSCLL
jgi:hypothetical protein